MWQPPFQRPFPHPSVDYIEVCASSHNDKNLIRVQVCLHQRKEISLPIAGNQAYDHAPLLCLTHMDHAAAVINSSSFEELSGTVIEAREAGNLQSDA